MKFAKYLIKKEVLSGPSEMFAVGGLIEEWIAGQKQEEFILTVEPIKSKRNNAQNRLIHKICREFVVLAQANAITIEDFSTYDLSHWTMEHFKGLFTELFLKPVDPKTGITITRTTSQLNTKECAIFLDKVIQEFLRNGGVIMDKDEVFKEAMGI